MTKWNGYKYSCQAPNIYAWVWARKCLTLLSSCLYVWCYIFGACCFQQKRRSRWLVFRAGSHMLALAVHPHWRPGCRVTHPVPFCQGCVSTFTAFSFIPPTPLLHRSAPFCSWWAWLVSFTQDVICFVGWCRHSVPHFTFLYEFLWITARLHVLLGLDFYGTWQRWNTRAS